MLIWRPCSHREKAKWDFLYKSRHTDPDIFKKGNDLLKSRGLLEKLQLHSHAFQQHRHNVSEPSKPNTKTLTKASPSALGRVTSTSISYAT